MAENKNNNKNLPRNNKENIQKPQNKKNKQFLTVEQ